jgi:hypothetical protein
MTFSNCGRPVYPKYPDPSVKVYSRESLASRNLATNTKNPWEAGSDEFDRSDFCVLLCCAFAPFLASLTDDFPFEEDEALGTDSKYSG